MQHVGLKWLHPLLRQPQRKAWRYLVDCPAIFPLLLRERFVGRLVADVGAANSGAYPGRKCDVNRPSVDST